MLRDMDLDVRRAALLMANAAAHHNPDVIAPYMAQQVMPQLMETLQFKQERVVDLGPFKHKVDDGLPLRKVALTCVETVLDTLPEYLDVGAFMPRLVTVLGDKDEVKLQAYPILCRLCAYAPGAVLGFADALIDPLEKTVTKKANKDGVVGPEAERALELIRSGLRAVLVVNRIEDIAQNRRWADFVEKISRKDVCGELLESLQAQDHRAVDF
jgi:cullin-associated NEDD8-dissociated protein 1